MTDARKEQLRNDAGKAVECLHYQDFAGLDFHKEWVCKLSKEEQVYWESAYRSAYAEYQPLGGYRP